MTTSELLTTGWNWNALSITSVALAALGTAWGIRRAGRAAAAPWTVGLLLFVIAMASPLATLAQGYLFTAHMLQHLLLLLIIPLLFVAGRPAGPPRQGGWRVPTALAWVAGVGSMWLWHEPSLCSLASTSQAMLGFQTVFLLVAGFLFWLPAHGRSRLSSGPAIFYLFTACLACTALGVYITFVPVTVCPAFTAASPDAPLVRLIRGGWNISAAADQQMGGLLMWVPCCGVYLTSVIAQFARWHAGAPINSTPA